MDAIVISKYGDENELVLQKAEIPKPGNKQVLIKVHAAGVNPLDVIYRLGYLGDFNPKVPFINGVDVAGEILEVGAESSWKKGERVFGHLAHGGYAQYAVLEDDFVHHLPQNVSYEKGGGIYTTYFTAVYAIHHKSQTKKEDVLLIHGASGGVGSAAIQVAKLKGIKEIWGTAGSHEGLEQLKKEGCTQVFNHREEGYVDKIIKLGGANVILEMVANLNLNNDLKIIKTGGIIVVIGVKGEVSIDGVSLLMKQATIIGLPLLLATKQEREEIGKLVSEGLTSGILNPIVAKTYSLKDAPQSHRDISSSTSSKGKLILLPWN